MCATQEAEKAKRITEEAIKYKYVAAKEAEQALAEVRKYRHCAEHANVKEEPEKAKISENTKKELMNLKCNALLLELDGVGPIDNRPSTD